MKKQFLYLFVLVFTNLLVNAQTILILDKSNNAPVDLVVIMSENPMVSVTTNSEGKANISQFASSKIIEFKRAGYKSLYFSYADLKSADFKLFMEVSAVNLDEVVVSATRWRQGNSDIPIKVVGIRSAEIALINPQTSADLLGVSSKIFIQKSQQGGGSPMIRGFATNRLLYSIDGVRMNTAIFRSGNIQNVISLDPFAIQSAEVLFGPGSVIYGSDAIGGVMSFQTLLPEFSFSDKPLISGKAITRYSSANNEKTGHFDVNVGWKKWAFVTSFSSFDFDHLRQGSKGPIDYVKPFYVNRVDGVDMVFSQDDPLLQIPTGYQQSNLMQKIRFKPNDHWDFVYGFHYSETSNFGRYDRHNRLKNGLPRYAEWDYGPQIWSMHYFSVENSNVNFFYDQVNLRAALQKFEESRIDRSLNMVERNTQTEFVDAFSINFDFVKKSGSKNTIFYGAEYVVNDVISKGLLTNISSGQIVVGPARYPLSNWTTMGVYFNDQYKFSEKFILQSGLRYSFYAIEAEFDTTFYPFPFTSFSSQNGALTGSAGFVFHPAKSWTISSNFGTAFRAPNIDDLGKVFDSEPGSVVIPNPDLEAEYAYNVDFSVAKVFGETVKVDLTGFYTILQNALVRRDFTLNGLDSIMYFGELSKVQAVQNAAKANVYGLQVGFEIKLPANFFFASDFNYQVGEEELDDGSISPSRHAAPFYGISRISYKYDKLAMEFYAVYQGERKHEGLAEEEKAKTEIYALDNNGQTYAPGWYTINFKSMYKLSKELTISAGLENITDQRYRSYSSGISGAGRNFVISLSARF